MKQILQKEKSMDMIFFGLTAFILMIWTSNFDEGYDIVYTIGHWIGGIIGCYAIPTLIYLIIRIFSKIDFGFVHISAFFVSLMALVGANM